MSDGWIYYEVRLSVRWSRGAQQWSGDLVTRVHAQTGGHAIARAACDLPSAFDIQNAQVVELSAPEPARGGRP